MRSRAFKLAILLLTGAVVAETASGAIPRMPRSATAGRTKTYDVRDLIWNGMTIEEVTHGVMSFFPLKIWRRDGGPRIREIDRGKLEIQASIIEHGEIADVLQALRQMADLAVIWEAQLLEIDRDCYDKEILPALAQDKGVTAILKKRGALVHSCKRTSLNGKQVKLLSLRRPVPYTTGPNGAFELAFTGLSFEVKTVVTIDRQYVRGTIVRHSAELVGMEKKSYTDPVSGKSLDIESPNLREATVSSSAKIVDGAMWLVPLVHPTPEFRKEGRMLVLSLRPTIYIDAEQKFLQGR